MYPQPINRLVAELAKLPGIGQRTAQRLAFHILRSEDADAVGARRRDPRGEGEGRALRGLLQPLRGPALRDLRGLAPRPLADLRRRAAGRRDPDRAHARVPRPLPRARRGAVADRRHRSRGPEDRRAGRAGRAPRRSTEVVLATNPTTTGEATAHHIAELLRGKVSITRLASGLPVGADLEHADEVTLGRALSAGAVGERLSAVGGARRSRSHPRRSSGRCPNSSLSRCRASSFECPAAIICAARSLTPSELVALVTRTHPADQAAALRGVRVAVGDRAVADTRRRRGGRSGRSLGRGARSTASSSASVSVDLPTNSRRASSSRSSSLALVSTASVTESIRSILDCARFCAVACVSFTICADSALAASTTVGSRALGGGKDRGDPVLGRRSGSP